MKSIFQSAGSFTAVLAAAAALTGCAAVQEEHRQHHPDPATANAQGGMGPGGKMGMMGGAGGQMDMKARCETHEKMQSARTPEERSAMMEDRMKNMSAEMRQRHMEMMQQQCK